MKLRFECDGRYEAEKLAALVSVQKDDSNYVIGVAAIVGNEIVIRLKDKSSHAVVMKDGDNVARLKALLDGLEKGAAVIVGSDYSGEVAEITTKD
jgi:hypothetical protein